MAQKTNTETKTDSGTNEDIFKQDLIKKISSLTAAQTEHLADFLNEPYRHVGSVKDDVVVLSDLLVNLRNTLAYKNRKQQGSTESQVYKKYLREESKIELELYRHLRSFGVQLRKDGYNSVTCQKDLLNLTEEELIILNSVFPENNTGQQIQIPLPLMSQSELEIRDAESNARHTALKSTGVVIQPTKVGKMKKNKTTSKTKMQKRKSS
jgi:hypothetical protein